MPFNQLLDELGVTNERDKKMVLGTLFDSRIQNGVYNVNVENKVPYYRFLKRLLYDGEIPVRAVIGLELHDDMSIMGTEIFSHNTILKENMLTLSHNLAKIIFPSYVENNAITSVGVKRDGKHNIGGFIGRCFAKDIIWMSGNKTIEPVNNPYIAEANEVAKLWLITKRATGVVPIRENLETLSTELGRMPNQKKGMLSKYIPITSYHQLWGEVIIYPYTGELIRLSFDGTITEADLNLILVDYFRDIGAVKVESSEDIAERNYRDRNFWLGVQMQIQEKMSGNTNGAGAKAFKAIMKELSIRNEYLKKQRQLAADTTKTEEEKNRLLSLPCAGMAISSICELEDLTGWLTYNEAIEDLTMIKNVSHTSAKQFIDLVKIRFKRRLA